MYNEIFNNTGKVQISREKNKFKSEIKWSAKKIEKHRYGYEKEKQIKRQKYMERIKLSYW